MNIASLMRSRPAFPVIVSGPSGVGKTSIVQSALTLRPNLRPSISTTTRPPRDGETSGVSYDFVTEAEFERQRLAGNFLETAEVHGHLYGTPRDRLLGLLRDGHTVVLNLDVQGGSSMRKAFQDGVFVFILPPSMEVLRERLLQRRTDPLDVVEMRLENAREEMAQAQQYSYVIVNENLEQATTQLLSIVDAEQCRAERRMK